MMTRSLNLTASILLTLVSVTTALGQQSGTRELLVTVRNDRPDFMVRVSVNQPDRIYREGETLTATVRSGRAGYLYLIYCNAEGKAHCVFPNKYQQENRIPAGVAVTVPGGDADFDFTVGGPPFGREVLKAIVTAEKLEGELPVRKLIDAAATPLQEEALKELFVTLRRRPVSGWAEHSVEILTHARDQEPPKQRARRVGVFIGISDYQDARIRDLRVSHLDARQMASVMKEHGQLDHAIVLVNEQATLEAIKKAICETLKGQTAPGDEVFIYWSGHGGRCSDDGGDEKDGFDEYLVPHNGSMKNLEAIRNSMVIDDAFGRWVQELDGRRVVVILDTCFSGGQSAASKGLPGVPSKAAEFDFFDGDFARAKDLKQEESAVLASSAADQVSMERKEGGLSVMTHILATMLAEDKEGVTLSAAFGKLKEAVPAYVREAFPGVEQTPVLFDTTTPPVYLRPGK